MPKTLFLTLRVTVDDLPRELRAIIADDTETPLADLPGLADVSAVQVGEALAGVLDGAGCDAEMLVGDGVNVQLLTAEVAGAEWASEG